MNVNATHIVDVKKLSSAKKNIEKQVTAVSAMAMALLLLVGIVGLLNNKQ